MDPTEYNTTHGTAAGIDPASLGAKGWDDLDAIKAWQQARGLTADGLFGPRSVAAWQATRAITGVDLSGNNPIGPDDFARIASAGHRFAWLKATEGTGYAFARRGLWSQAARDAGLAVGYYHFAKPSGEPGDAVREAEWFAKAAGTHTPGDMPPVLDLETNKAGLHAEQLVDWAIDWLTRAEALCGFKPIVYTYTSFWQYNLRKTKALTPWPLWQAEYSKKGRPTPLGDWPCMVWQHTGHGHVPGVAGRIDLNKFYGTDDVFKSFRGL